MLAAALLLLQAGAAAPAFAPPLDRPLLVTTEHRSAIDGAERRYTLRRLIRFHASDTGYRAEVRVLAPDAETPASMGGMVEAAFATLAGRTLVFRLDAAGKVTEVEEMAALWERLCQAIGTMAAGEDSAGPAGRAALARRIAAPLRAFPAERQRAMLGTLVSAVIADEPVDPAGTVTPVRLPGTSPLGQELMLEGVRTTASAGDGQVQSVVRASGRAPLPGGDGRIDLERTRRSDPRTGLVTFSSDTSRTVAASSTETVRTTTVVLAPAPAGAWAEP